MNTKERFCSAERTGPVGSMSHRDWCDLHGTWTFDCLLRLRLTFRPLPDDKKYRAALERKRLRG